MKKVFTILFFYIGLYSLFAQNGIPCHADEMNFKLVQENPNLLSVFEQKRQELEVFTKNYAQSFHAKSGPYIIPVVFHVIHLNGPENISEEQINDALKNLNEQFNKRNADTVQTINAFKGIAANVQVEFRLAKIDPNGNCTNGITRHYSTTSITGDHNVKNVVHWPPNKYLNIYVCQDAAGLAGHSLMPAIADSLPQWDGIVMRHDYVGAIGTSQWLHRTVLTHEVGHYLNLYHIWGGNNVPGFYYLPVANAGNCAYDDEVSDTPNTIGWQTCNINGSSCGTLDNVQNYMDYSYCSTMFTEGQKIRIHAALNSPIANRNNLWQPSNLVATGVINNGNLCFADFEVTRPYICVGDTLEVFDRSYHNVQTRLWNISNGTIISQQDSSVKVVFSQEGKQTIELTVSDGTVTKTILKSDILEVLPANVSNDFLWENFEYPTNNNRAVLINNTNNWKFSSEAASGSNGYWTDNFNNGIRSYSFDLHPVNLVALSNPAIVFDRAYAMITNSPLETLEIKASTNCGKTWNTFRSFTSSSLKTVQTNTDSAAYFPINSEWSAINSFIIPSSYRKEHVMFRFTYNGKGYNNLFLDNINIGNQDKLNTAFIQNSSFVIYPNPASENITIYNPTETPFQLSIRDLTGKILSYYNVESNESTYSINTSHFSSGLLLIEIVNQNGRHLSQLVIE